MGDKIIIFVVIGIILVLGVIALLLILKKKKSSNVYNEKIEKIITHLGGHENIINVNAKMSRVEFSLNNYDLVNKDELKNLGVQGISKTSQKITLVVGNELANDLNKAFNRN